MKDNPLRLLQTAGQSLWLDYIRKDLITSGELARLIREDGLRGMTSNPAIFEKAIAQSSVYDDDIQALAREGKDAGKIFDAIALGDVRSAADVFRPLYDETGGADGFVSLEVNPHLARDTQATLAEARRLWAELDRPNAMVKVPATLEGLPAIQQLVSEGVNVNVTLLFGLPRYRQVAEAFLTGLEARADRGGDLGHVASVASFFVSRMDVLLDPQLEAIIAQGGPRAGLAKDLLGTVAVANAKMAYQAWKAIFSDGRFRSLAAKGARPQRVLWASTGTKNPAYRDVKYVEELIGAETVNTVPMETIEAFRDHGIVEARLEVDTEGAAGVLKRLPGLGFVLDDLTRQLEEEGVEKFDQPFDKLLASLTSKISPPGNRK